MLRLWVGNDKGEGYVEVTILSQKVFAELCAGDMINQGQTIAAVIKGLRVSEVTVYLWHKEFGGMNRSLLKRLKELGQESARLHEAVPDRHWINWF